MEQTKYDLFISYSRRDFVDEHKNVIPGNEVSKIKEALSSAGISFWMDEKGIIPGEDYAAKITKHIADLDRIDYYVNPQQGLEILVSTINTCLEKLANEEKRKQEELIKSIRLENEVLNANETKLMAERKTLLLRSQ